MSQQCREKDCLCFDVSGSQCGYGLPEGKTIYSCCKKYGHTGKHHSCGSIIKNWEAKEPLHVEKK